MEYTEVEAIWGDSPQIPAANTQRGVRRQAVLSNGLCKQASTIDYIKYNWKVWEADFTDFAFDVGEDTRVPRRNGLPYIGIGEVDSESASVLCASKPRDSDVSGTIPVLFVHGYTLESLGFGGSDGDFGGGKGTWKDFTKLADEWTFSEKKTIIFEFRWRTNARFQDVAVDLKEAIEKITLKTGNSVHIIAHSFGGVLTRTYLQSLANTGFEYAANPLPIASATTVGSPHSGIGLTGGFDPEQTEWHDFTNAKFCNQASCFQMGMEGDASTFGSLKEKYSNNFKRGEITEALDLRQFNFSLDASRQDPRKIPIQGLIGYRKERNDDNDEERCQLSTGDGLISPEGQRFKPSYGFSERLKRGDSVQNANVTEKLLGLDQDSMLRAETPVPCVFDGYGHTKSHLNNDIFRNFGFDLDTKKAEVWINEPFFPSWGAAENCNYSQNNVHPTLTSACEWIKNNQVDAINLSSMTFHFSVVDRLNLPVNNIRVYIDSSEYEVVPGEAAGEYSLKLPFNPDSFRAISIVPPSDSNLLPQKTLVIMRSTVSETDTQLGRIVLSGKTDFLAPVVGRFINAVTGEMVANVTYEAGVRTSSGEPEPIRKLTSSDGTFNFGVIPIRNLVVRASAENFEESGWIDVQTQTKNNGQFDFDIVLSPKFQASGKIRIILTWNQDPRDLDSHLSKYSLQGDPLYHLYWDEKTDSGTGDNLDLDDRFHEGPETITINSLDGGARYVYAVNDFAGSGSITGTSNAVVRILTDTSNLIYHAPTSGVGDWWKVFEVVNGKIIPCQVNCMFENNSAID